MIRLPGLTLLLLAPPTAAAQQPPAANDWENPAVFAINKEPARASLVSFPGVNAFGKIPNATTPTLSLNGEWRFHWAPRPADRPTDFFNQLAPNSLVKAKGSEMSDRVISAEEVEFELEF